VILSRRRILAASATTLAMPYVARAQQASITLAAYSGIFQDNYEPAVVETFRRANPGIKVTYFSMGNSAQALGQLRAQKANPQVDLVMMDVSVAKAASDEGLFEPVTAAQVPAIADLSPRAFTPGVTAPAVTFDNLVLLYSPQKVQPAPTSWKVFWEEKYKDQIAISGVPDIVGLGFLMMANKVFGGDDYRRLDKGFEAVGNMAPNVLSWDPKPDAYTMITQGTASLGVGWNARGQIYSDQSGGRMAAILPSEGSLFQINVLGLVKGAKNYDASRAFMNHALGAEAQAAFTEKMFYAPVNTKAKVSDAALARTASSAERQAMMLPVDWLEVAKFREGVTEQWRRRILTRR
jgi:putative spermidine/putrescine transport system substrate-binding protein